MESEKQRQKKKEIRNYYVCIIMFILLRYFLISGTERGSRTAIASCRSEHIIINFL